MACHDINHVLPNIRSLRLRPLVQTIKQARMDWQHTHTRAICQMKRAESAACKRLPTSTTRNAPRNGGRHITTLGTVLFFQAGEQQANAEFGTPSVRVGIRGNKTKREEEAAVC